MFSQNQIEDFVFFDIETTGCESKFNNLTPRLQGLWRSRAEILQGHLGSKYPDNLSYSAEELFEQKAGLQAEFGQVVCISFGRVKFDGLGEPHAQIVSVYDGNEAQILEKAFAIMENFTKRGAVLLGHNVKRFDIPFLCKRGFINKISLPNCLQVWDKKPWEIAIRDTSELWSFGAWQEGFCSLDLLTAVLGVPSPKEELKGNEVHKTYYAGGIEKIADYCNRDVAALIKIAISLACLNQLEDTNITFSKK
jgi:predicted PolB exonuclease-like 3'-5' exonuclease